jgi:large-conductance mechanosensitive channel
MIENDNYENLLYDRRIRVQTTNLVINEKEYFFSIEHITPTSRSYAKFNFSNFCNLESIKRTCEYMFSCKSSSTSTISFLIVFFFIFFWYKMFKILNSQNSKEDTQHKCEYLNHVSEELILNYRNLLYVCSFIILGSLLIHKYDSNLDREPHRFLDFLSRIFSLSKIIFHIYFFTTNLIFLFMIGTAINRNNNCGSLGTLAQAWFIFFIIFMTILSLCILSTILLILKVIRKFF